MNRMMLYLTMASIFLLLSVSIISTTRRHLSVMNKSYDLQNQVVYLNDSIQFIKLDTIIKQVHDTIIIAPKIKIERIYVVDTTKIQDSIKIQNNLDFQ